MSKLDGILGGKLDGKVALVSGSGRGIGRSMALKLASEGAKIVVNDVDVETGDEVTAEVNARGGEAIACNGDVTAVDFPDRFINTATETFGGVDIIVNNAGYAWLSMIQNHTDKQFQAMLDVHLVAPFRILRAALPFIRKTSQAEAAEGRTVYRKVVNISSGAGMGGSPGHAGYGAGKMGVVGLTNVLAKEWGRYKVNVNCVSFGLIRTRLNEPLAEGESRTMEFQGVELPLGMEAGRFASIGESNALGHAGTPEDAANAVYLFCAPESDFISGQTLTVSGG